MLVRLLHTFNGISQYISEIITVFYARKWNKENPDKQVFETRKIEGENG